MESNHKEAMDHGKSKTNKGILILLIIIVLVLGASVGIMLSKLSDQKKKRLKYRKCLKARSKSLKKI